MKIIITGHHIDLGSSLTNHIESTIKSIASKYFENVVSASISITKERHHNLIHTQIIINEGTGTRILIKANASAYEPYESFAKAVERVNTQLAKYKQRIKNHHKHNKDDAGLKVAKYTISSMMEEGAEAAPTIIAEKQANIESISVAEAVMKMDLLHLPALLFIHNKNNRLNMVYYRHDGNIAWVDTENKI